MGECSGANTWVRPYAPPERRGESCIRPLCPIRPYAQKLRLHRAMLYAFRRSTRNPIRAKFFIKCQQSLRYPTGNNLPTLLAYLSQILVPLVCCNDSYIVHYAPVCARSRTSVLYDPGFAIRVNYFLWDA
uniref:Uncharacterized protein n=1 Tax=Candidatus Kentrum sp. FM TaxID=2126340 RepID=A0A450T642_9GAMM|nr:MAG: hypothetical protein BECKFM1743C_GA0114222_103023 [Candidatus Kentron sp. FM]